MRNSDNKEHAPILNIIFWKKQIAATYLPKI